MYLKINNLNLYYEKYGTKKQSIIILPGWGNNRITFNYLIHDLNLQLMFDSLFQEYDDQHRLRL